MKYEIRGESMPVVICTLDAGESMITEAGGMVWMSPNMRMETNAGGSVGRALGRIFSGESMFQNVYTAEKVPGMIAFASSMPGTILPIDLRGGRTIVVQKRGFLASEAGVNFSVFFQRKGMSGFFGGEGFIMQKLQGEGTAFVEIDGAVVEYQLGAGEQLVVDTGNLAMCDASCSIDVVTVKGLKNKLFGGEGLFNTVVTGPGHVWLQTMPLSSLASTIASVIPSK